MKIYKRSIKGKINKYNKDIILNIYSESEKGDKKEWGKLFTDILTDIEYNIGTENNLPSFIEVFLDQTYSQSNLKDNRDSKDEDLDKLSKDLLSIIDPKFKISDIILPDYAKNELEEIVFYCNHKKEIDDEILPDHLRSNEVGIYINFYGPSGTGKTMAAEIIASRLSKKLMVVNYANLESELVGRTSKNIHAIFKIANTDDCLLMFDEADSFLSSRITDLRQSADYSINTSRSQLLKELETYKGIIIFATNNLKNYDIAFQRRLHYNLNFPLPNIEARTQILKKQCFSSLFSNEIDFKKISEEIDGFSGGDIQNLVKRTIIRGIQDIKLNIKQQIDIEHINYGIRVVKLSKTAFDLVANREINISQKAITNDELLNNIEQE